jgi:hypothetical protein
MSWAELLPAPASPHCLSDLALDQLLSAETTSSQAAARGHLAGCDACAQRLRSLEASAAALFELHPVLGLERPATARASSPARRLARVRWGRWATAAGVAAAAAALLLLVGAPLTPSGMRSKGGSSVAVELFVQRGDGRIEELLPEGTAAPGDALRFALSSGMEPGYVAVLSVDGGGKVSAYAPSEGELAALSAQERRLLEGSIVLDEQVGRERVVALLCAQRVSLDELLRALRAAGPGAQHGSAPIELGLECAQSSFWFTKVERE